MFLLSLDILCSLCTYDKLITQGTRYVYYVVNLLYNMYFYDSYPILHYVSNCSTCISVMKLRILQWMIDLLATRQCLQYDKKNAAIRNRLFFFRFEPLAIDSLHFI